MGCAESRLTFCTAFVSREYGKIKYIICAFSAFRIFFVHRKLTISPYRICLKYWTFSQICVIITLVCLLYKSKNAVFVGDCADCFYKHPSKNKERIMKKRTIFLPICLAAAMLPNMVYAEKISETPIYFNDTLMEFKNPPMVEDGCTIVPIRELSEKAGFKVLWDRGEKSIDAYNEKTQVTMYIGDKKIRVLSCDGEDRDVESILPPEIKNSVTYVPLRTVAEAFGAEVIWDSSSNNVYIYMKDILSAVEETAKNNTQLAADYSEKLKEEQAAAQAGNTFYSQYDPTYIELYGEAPYNWTAGRNGYCYVVSYAMLLSDITGTAVTPKDVADINYNACGNPTMCYHGSIVGNYGRKLAQALDSGSAYFKSYDAGRGLTYIDNSSEESVVAAIKEALQKHPEGVMVRDTSMPHTMVATKCEGDTIYFNDPALLEGNVTWEQTCLKKRDITTIAALAAID